MVVGILIDHLSNLVIKRLNKRELIILELIKGNQNKTASQICVLSEIPKSTFWFNLRRLSKQNLIKFQNTKPLSLTPLGEIITCDSSTGRAAGRSPVDSGSNPGREIIKFKPGGKNDR